MTYAIDRLHGLLYAVRLERASGHTWHRSLRLAWRLASAPKGAS